MPAAFWAVCVNVEEKFVCLVFFEQPFPLFCRYLDFGDLPFPNEVKEFHSEKIREREITEGRKMDLQKVIDDFWAFSKGSLIGGNGA